MFWDKNGFRVLALDDAPFLKNKESKTIVVGIITRGQHFLEAALSFSIKIDGDCATTQLIKAINNFYSRENIHLILIGGVSWGGFNLLDIHYIYKKTQIPVLVVIRKYPNLNRMFEIIKKFPNSRRKHIILSSLPPVEKIRNIYVQYVGLPQKAIDIILSKLCYESYMPEPLRMAHIIAAAIKRGYSSRSRV